MKKNQVKIFIGLLLVFLVSALSFAFFYFANVNIINPLNFRILSDSSSELYAISPTGGRIVFFQDTVLNSFNIDERYIKEVVVLTSEPKEFSAILILGKDTVVINNKTLIHIKDNIYKIDPKLFPKVGLYPKLLILKESGSISLFAYHFKKVKYYFIFLLGITSLLSSIFLLIIYLKSNLWSLVYSFRTSFKHIICFLKSQWKQIIFVFLLSCLPPLIFTLFDNNVSVFLDISELSFVLIFASVIFPLTFLAFFSKKLKINAFFWWSFLISFLILLFVTKSSFYIYGIGFRDDISKFFVKAYSNNLIDSLFKPDAGYLNLYQNLSTNILLRVLNFKQYFPEALQIYTAMCFSALYASFNFKLFRLFLADDRYRFFISVLFALSPFVFLSSIFLYEVPIAAAAILFLFIFTNFDKHSINKTRLVTTTIFFVVFALSKPIFLILIPFILAVIIRQGVINKNRVQIKLFILIFISIMIQLIVVYFSSNNYNISEFPELGTHYQQSFSLEHRSISVLLPSAIFIFIHKFSEFSGLIYSNSSLLNLMVNILTIGCIIFIIVYNVVKIVKKQRVLISWFCLSAFMFSFLSVLLYVEVVNPEDLVLRNPNFIDLKFTDMLQSKVIIPWHRYLIPAAFANFMVFLVSLFEITDRLIQSNWLRHSIRIFLIVFVASVPFFRWIKQYHEVRKLNEIESYWRTYNNLIFSSNGEYYIPYNGFPNQKHCIKYGIDKIIDVSDVKNNRIIFSELHSNAKQWRIIQIILENNSNGKFAELQGYTTDGDIVTAILVNDSQQPLNSLVYRFDKFYKFECLNINYSDTLTQYVGMVRIIGKYE